MPLTPEARSKGGQVSALLQRQKAIDAYYLNPNFCRQCKQVIKVPESKKIPLIKKKKFCTMSCAAKFNNKKRVRILSDRNCFDCQKPLTILKERRNKFCPDCWITRDAKLSNTPKSELDRRMIYHHAQNVMRNIARSCSICGYDKHAEICHIKSIASFPSTALLSEINAKENLVLLCPNHHWELDKGLISNFKELLYPNAKR